MNMEEKIIKLAQGLREKSIIRRRDFHQHPEAGWTEFRTASIVAKTLTELGYDVLAGSQVHDENAMMGVPEADALKNYMDRALTQGADPYWVEKMSGGKTGIIGEMKFAKPGPVVAIRVDMDANDMPESTDEGHRPVREGFASVNKEAMHSCGHDGHTAIGLAVAEILAEMKDQLAGTIKLIFQPAEEGVRGARAMMEKGVVDDVDYLFAMHIGLVLKKSGQLACKTGGYLATTKIDAVFTGLSAHPTAGAENGRNAILAACNATLNLHAISRHSQGLASINVGIISGGTGRNVVPGNAMIKVETRGATSEINEYVYNESIRIIEAAAQMLNCKVEITLMGGATSCENDDEIADVIRKVAEKQGLFTEIIPSCQFSVSEDCTYFMKRVQHHGGKAAYILVGSDMPAGNHDKNFDFNEEDMTPAIALMAGAAVDLLK